MGEQALLSFGLWIKRRRKALDLTQEALAARVGCSKELIVKIEGDARRPSRQIAVLLAQHLQLAPDESEDFVRCARAELVVDRLPSPTRSMPRAAFPSQSPAERPRSNLPAQLSSFLGREQELADLPALLRSNAVRLVTLSGPGGIGKTRLALQTATEILDAFSDGVYFVDLAPISDPELVVTTIAQTLGVTGVSERPAEQLKAALRHKRLLLLLDNFEQLLDAAPLVAELLAAAPGLKVLATSRVQLHLSGEHEYAVPPLALPPTNDHRPPTTDQPDAATIGQYAAVQLFIQRAQAAKADFAVTNATAPAVAEICVRLDGLPLAIELAASRIKLFPPEALLSQLTHPLALLTGGPRDLPARQQTLRNTIDWSYNLLSPAEQTLFRRLAVFVGGFSLDAAEAVDLADGDQTIDVLAGLSALVDHSLVRLDSGWAGEPRYGMLETLHEYALERLREVGEEQETHRRHAAFFAAWAEAAPSSLSGDDFITSERLTRELGNIRAVLNWSFACPAGEDVLYGLRLFGSVWEVFWLRYSIEGSAIAERALACASAHRQDLAVARIYNAVARLQKNSWDGMQSIELLQRSLSLAQQYDDRPLQAEVLRHLGEAMCARDLRAATQVLEESLRISREVNDVEQEGWTMFDLGGVAGLSGDLDDAERCYQYSLAIFARLNLPVGQTFVLQRLSQLSESRGDSAEADRYLARALALIERFGLDLSFSPLVDHGRLACQRGDYQRALDLLGLGYDQVVGINVNHLGADYHGLGLAALMWQAVCHLELGNLVKATDLCRQALAIALENVEDIRVSQIMIIVANVAVASGRHAAAARLLGWADSYLASTSYKFEYDHETDWKRLYDRALAACRTALDEEVFQAAWAVGQALTLEQAVAEVLAGADEPGSAAKSALGDAT
jgi:predicted ATPase/transcriptional regulator with XRE-family HTH domain